MDQNTDLSVEPQPKTNEYVFCCDAEMYEIIENCISHTDGEFVIGIETKQFKNLSINSNKFVPDWKDQWIRNPCMFLENNVYTDITNFIKSDVIKHIKDLHEDDEYKNGQDEIEAFRLYTSIAIAEKTCTITSDIGNKYTLSTYCDDYIVICIDPYEENITIKSLINLRDFMNKLKKEGRISQKSRITRIYI